MTPDQHITEAQRLADQANHYTYGDGADARVGMALAAEAQVHALLAIGYYACGIRSYLGQIAADLEHLGGKR